MRTPIWCSASRRSAPTASPWSSPRPTPWSPTRPSSSPPRPARRSSAGWSWEGSAGRLVGGKVQLRDLTTNATVAFTTAGAGIQGFTFLLPTLTFTPSTAVDADRDTITVANHGLKTGDMVLYTTDRSRSTTAQAYQLHGGQLDPVPDRCPDRRARRPGRRTEQRAHLRGGRRRREHDPARAHLPRRHPRAARRPHLDRQRQAGTRRLPARVGHLRDRRPRGRELRGRRRRAQ